jgi:hypothetical protein
VEFPVTTGKTLRRARSEQFFWYCVVPSRPAGKWERRRRDITAAVRQRSLIIPREHGAWGILLVPLATGASLGLLAGGSAQGLAAFTLVALALFWLRTPVESWAGASPIRARAPGELRLVRRTAMALAVVAAGGLAWLLWGGRNRALLGIGCAAGAAFLIQSIVKRVWRSARTAAQAIGAAGLTSTAPAAYYVATGRLDTTAWVLWAANLLFAINQIQFVQLRIHAARAADRREKLSLGRGFLIAQTVLAGLLATACAAGVFRWYAAAAFLPVLYRGFAWFAARPGPLAIHRLGKSELAYACVFGVLLVLGIGLR